MRGYFKYILILGLILVAAIVAAYCIFKNKANETADSGEHSEEHQIIPPNKDRYFLVDYDHDQFLKDGKPFQYISGSLHYFRVPRAYWRDRLRKYRAAGLNAVSTYVEWSLHEPSPRDYRFTGEADLEYFLQLAVEEDLLVILRPGPYICAERDFGGFPSWLRFLYPEIQLRTNDTDYQREVKGWFDTLLPKLEKYLYGNGGPIIMVQVENEYGGCYTCNRQYTTWLRDLMHSHVQDNALLFTTDGYWLSFLQCGVIPSVYATVDFGTSVSTETAFANMREYQKHGPLVNSEFYSGWISNWEEPVQRVDTTAILNSMEEMLSLNASFNFYMFFGGTNFGFTTGANFHSHYIPELTSYDYDAPLNEAGDPTEKYFAIRNLISKYFPLPDIPVPEPAPKGQYGTVRLSPVSSLFDSWRIPNTTTVVNDAEPKSFEQLSIPYGYVLYETFIPEDIPDPAVLYVEHVRDRIIVYVDEIPRGILSRTRKINSIPLIPEPGMKLSLLVENQGRINVDVDLNSDKKGLLEAPILDGRKLKDWTMKAFTFDDVSWVEQITPSNDYISPPAYYYGELVLPSNITTPLDTYVDLTGWGKGVIFVNDINLGRYWPSVGSQVTLYVPGCYLKAAPQLNKIVVFETEVVPSNYEIKFVSVPYLSKIPPSIYTPHHR